MKKYFLLGLLLSTTSFLFAQAKIDEIINAKEVERIEKVLSSDDMRGRKTFTPDIDKAADFISGEFKKIRLKTWDNNETYRQGFALVRPKQISTSATFDGSAIDPKNIITITCQPDLHIDEKSGYTIEKIKNGDNL